MNPVTADDDHIIIQLVTPHFKLNVKQLDKRSISGLTTFDRDFTIAQGPNIMLYDLKSNMMTLACDGNGRGVIATTFIKKRIMETVKYVCDINQ